MKVFLVAAITADGYIARDKGHVADWTSKADKRVFVELTKQAGVMVMGRTTYETINRALPERQTIVYSRAEVLELPENVRQSQKPPKELVNQLATEGYEEVAVCGGSEIYTLFMMSGLVTDLYLTVEPVIFGTGIPLFTSSLDYKLELIEQKNLEPDVLLLHYRVTTSA